MRKKKPSGNTFAERSKFIPTIFAPSQYKDTSYVKSKVDKMGIISKIKETKPILGKYSHTKYELVPANTDERLVAESVLPRLSHPC